MIKTVDMDRLTEPNANHIILSCCHLQVNWRRLVDWCGSLGSCKPQIEPHILSALKFLPRLIFFIKYLKVDLDSRTPDKYIAHTYHYNIALSWERKTYFPHLILLDIFKKEFQQKAVISGKSWGTLSSHLGGDFWRMYLPMLILLALFGIWVLLYCR